MCFEILNETAKLIRYTLAAHVPKQQSSKLDVHKEQSFHLSKENKRIELESFTYITETILFELEKTDERDRIEAS